MILNLFQRLLQRGWWAILAVFFAGAVWSGLLLPGFRVEFGTDVLLNEKDTDLHYYNKTRAEWGDDEYLVACAHREEGWFTPEGAKLLCELAQDMKRLPGARSIMAATTVPLLRNAPGGLLKRPTMARPDGTLDPTVNLERAREELTQHTLALGNVVSADGKDISVLAYLEVSPEVVSLDRERRACMARPDDAAAQKRLKEIAPKYQEAKEELAVHRTAMVLAAREVAKRWEPRIGKVRLSGLPVINVGLLEHVRSDITNFGILALGVFTLALLVIYRRLRWLFLPLVACLLPVAFMLGVMAWTRESMTIVTSNMPVLLFVLMLPYAVYFIERYRERRRLAPEEPMSETCARSTAEIWRPCLYSALATMVGTAAHIGSGIHPVRTFGIMMTLGTGLGLVTIMLFIPAATAQLRPLQVPAGDPAAGPVGPLRLLSAIVLRAPAPVVVLSLLILGVSVFYTFRLKVETKFIDYFWQRSEVYQGLDYIDKQLGGTTPIEVILHSEKKGFFLTQEGLDALDTVGNAFKDDPAFGSLRSLKTLVDEVRKAMPPKAKPEFIANLITTQLPKEIVSELTLNDAKDARVLVRLRETSPKLNRNNLIRTIRERLAAMKPKELKNCDAQITGVCLLYSNILNGLIRTMKETFLIAVVSIWFMLWFLFRSPVMATIVLLPQVLPVFLVLGVMGFTGIALDMVTVVIASVAMGVGIDAAIQYAFRFRSELAACGGDFPEAVKRSHATIGRAILIATVITFTGFIMLMLSHFVPTFYFGMFTGLAILMGLFASLTTLPALFVLLKYPKIRGETPVAPEAH